MDVSFYVVIVFLLRMDDVIIDRYCGNKAPVYSLDDVELNWVYSIAIVLLIK